MRALIALLLLLPGSFCCALAGENQDAAIPNLQADMWKTSGGETLTCSATELPNKVRALKPGHVLRVAPGVLDRLVTVKVSGTAEAPITICAEKRHHTRVKGFRLAGDYLVVDGFEITSSSPRAVGIHAGEVHRKNAQTGCQVRNNYIHDITTTAVVLGTQGLAKDNLIRNVGRGFMVNGGSLIEGNEVDTLTPQYHKAKNGKPKKLVKTQYAFFAGDTIVFRGNYFHSTPKKLLKSAMGICFFTTWDAWIFSSSSNILVENNICFNGTHASEPSASARKKSSNYTLRNNLFADTVYVGVLPMHFTNITVENNTFINCGAYPIWFQTKLQTRGAVVRNNVIAYINRASDVKDYDWKPAESGIRNNCHPGAPIVCENNMFDGCVNRQYSKTDFSARPVFMDPAGRDFRLKPGSPGYDRKLGISRDLVARPVPCQAPAK